MTKNTIRIPKTLNMSHLLDEMLWKYLRSSEWAASTFVCMSVTFVSSSDIVSPEEVEGLICFSTRFERGHFRTKNLEIFKSFKLQVSYPSTKTAVIVLFYRNIYLG